MNGIINVYKEAGFTSFDVVAKLRGMLQTKKIGHTGTLDPEAVGVLPICVGNATKVVELLTDRTKEYVATIHFGVITDTQDMTGTVLEEHYDRLSALSQDEIADAIYSFQGTIYQIPPMYSALKVNGQKLVDLARKGIEIERKPREVTIYELEILNSGEEYQIRVVCSKGTYIRTLIHDIGLKLGCGAAMEQLERTRVGEFTKSTALTLSKLQELKDSGELDSVLQPVDIMFQNYPALRIKENEMKAMLNGNQLQPGMIEFIDTVTGCYEQLSVEASAQNGLKAKQVYRMYSYDNQFCALYEYHSGWKVLIPVKMFL